MWHAQRSVRACAGSAWATLVPLSLGIWIGLVPSAATAQVGPFRVGPIVGATAATVYGDEVVDEEWRKSFLVGGAMSWHPEGSRLGLESGAIYLSKGVNFGGGRDDGQAGLKLSYVEIPLLLRIRLSSDGGGVVPVLLLGSSLGINVGCQLEGSSEDVSFEIDCDAPELEDALDVNSLDAGLSGGAALEFTVSGRALSLSARYTRGLTDVADSAVSAPIRNSAVQVSLAYWL